MVRGMTIIEFTKMVPLNLLPMKCLYKCDLNDSHHICQCCSRKMGKYNMAQAGGKKNKASSIS